ncbi:MAG TPA: hemerythrin domain-containing protein [Acidimicrobiales bacterium]|jgi:hemerythrin-like domain-containing protein|nr:hemerythrin domain-containing protein [Acidimicrobiales bacterium]
MSGDGSTPNLIFVDLIHQSLRVDGNRMRDAVGTMNPHHPPSRLAGIRAFFDEYREQLLLHHRHEDEVFFPALEARVGADALRLDELTAQHEQLDAALQVAGDQLAKLADPTGDFATDRVEAARAFTAMVDHLDTHLRLEEAVALPLFESEVPVAEYRKLELAARRATPRPRARFLIPWLVADATADQQKALFGSAPPLRIVYWLNRRRYQRFARALYPAGHHHITSS